MLTTANCTKGMYITYTLGSLDFIAVVLDTYVDSLGRTKVTLQHGSHIKTLNQNDMSNIRVHIQDIKDM